MPLFVAIMRGEYDGKLRWPFKYKVTFTLIDQLPTNDDRRHITKDFWPNEQELCSGRPGFDMNESNGIPMFFPLNLFEKDQERYVQNDTMFIKITVDHLTERPSKICI
jgi:TNF receptor-associated factor 4